MGIDLNFTGLTVQKAQMLLEAYHADHIEKVCTPTPHEEAMANQPEEEIPPTLKANDKPGERPAAPRGNHGDQAWLVANKNRWDFLVREKKLTLDQFKAACHAINRLYGENDRKPYLSTWIRDATSKEVFDVLREAPQ